MPVGRPKKAPAASIPLLRELFDIADTVMADKDLAKRTGLNKASISAIRCGQIASPKLFTIQCIAEALGYRLTLEKVNGRAERLRKEREQKLQRVGSSVRVGQHLP